MELKSASQAGRWPAYGHFPRGWGRTVHLRRREGERGRPTIYWSNCEQQPKCCGGAERHWRARDDDCHFWAFVTSLILDVRNRGEKRRGRRRLFIHRPLSKADQRSKGKLGCESETHGIFSQVRDLKMWHQILILENIVLASNKCTHPLFSQTSRILLFLKGRTVAKLPTPLAFHAAFCPYLSAVSPFAGSFLEGFSL